MELAQRIRPAVVLLDIMMPGGLDGYDVCRRLNQWPEDERPGVIFLSALDRTSNMVKGLKLGAVDHIAKPFRPREVRARVATQVTVFQLRRALVERNTRLSHELRVAEEMFREARKRVAGPLLGDSEAVQELRAAAARRATDDEPLLMLGPPGCGQEAVARQVHLDSARHSRPFIHVDCMSLDDDLAQHLLEVGAEDTARAGDGRGPLYLAHGGTLYLRQVDRLPQEQQVQLAGYCALNRQARAADAAPYPDVRIIASSSQDLAQEVDDGRFDPALFASLRRRLEMPPLRRRREDIPTLARYFMQRQARRMGRMVDHISPHNLERLGRYRWPGNINELESFVNRHVILAEGAELTFDPQALGGEPVGSYQLLEKLAVGGMGVVWRTRPPS